MRLVAVISSFALAIFVAAAPGMAAEALAAKRFAALHEALTRAATTPPLPEESTAAARQRLTESVARLDKLLARQKPEIYAGWSRWLGLAALEEQLDASQPDLSALEKHAQRFYLDQQGLERAELLAVRRELRGFLTAHEYAASDSPAELYRKQLAELEDCLTRLEAAPTDADACRAGELLADLEPLSAESAELARSVRAQYCRTNAVAQASGRVVNLLMQQSVQEQTFIRDTVLGSFTQGTAYTLANVKFATIPDTDDSTFEIRMQGTVNAPSMVAQRGRISVNSSVQTSLYATKQVRLDENGLSLLPSAVSGNTNARIQDINAPSRFVESLAWRRASRMLPEAEQATTLRARTEAATKLDQQAASMLSGINDTYCNKIRGPLLRVGALPQMRFFSDGDRLRVELSQWAETQLAVATPAPEFPAEYDLACASHESMVNNFTETLLSGKTTQDEGYRAILQLMTGASPRALWVHDRADRWTATMALQRPFLIHFDNNQIGFTIRLTKVTHGERTYECPVEIHSHSQLKITADGPALIREGDIEVRIASGLDAAQEAELNNLLMRKFGAVFPPELYFDGFSAPAGGTIGRLRQLKCVEFSSSNGWMSIGYQIGAEHAVTAAADSP